MQIVEFNHPNSSYDIYHTTASVAGVAPVGRMCDELFACSLVEGLHLGRSFVLAHEMGHKYVFIIIILEKIPYIHFKHGHGA